MTRSDNQATIDKQESYRIHKNEITDRAWNNDTSMLRSMRKGRKHKQSFHVINCCNRVVVKRGYSGTNNEEPLSRVSVCESSFFPYVQRSKKGIPVLF